MIPSPAHATLHNMSMRPRTPVAVALGLRTGPFVRFAWPRSPREGLAGESPASQEAADRRLDSAWQAQAFRGAALVFPWSGPADAIRERFAAGPVPDLLAAEDASLCANVVRRHRSGLLLERTALCPLSALVGDEQLWTNDLQLVRIAVASGARRIQP